MVGQGQGASKRLGWIAAGWKGGPDVVSSLSTGLDNIHNRIDRAGSHRNLWPPRLTSSPWDGRRSDRFDAQMQSTRGSSCDAYVLP